MGGKSMKKIILVRHGESEFNAKGIIQGHIDTDLTPTGIIQAHLLAQDLKKRFKLEKIFSSDLRRAYRTAYIVGDTFNLEIDKDTRLREMYFGDWEGKSYKEILSKNKDKFVNWLKNPIKYPLPSQESGESFFKRLSEFLDYILKLKEKEILVVGHGGSIQGLLCLSLDIGLENLWAFKHTNTSYSVLQFENNKFFLKELNNNSHLEKLKNKENPLM